ASRAASCQQRARQHGAARCGAPAPAGLPRHPAGCRARRDGLTSRPATPLPSPLMRYVSTRGLAPELGFTDVLLAGLADDGGLYVPERWPALPALPEGGYAETAAAVMAPFVGDDIPLDEL